MVQRMSLIYNDLVLVHWHSSPLSLAVPIPMECQWLHLHYHCLHVDLEFVNSCIHPCRLLGISHDGFGESRCVFVGNGIECLVSIIGEGSSSSLSQHPPVLLVNCGLEGGLYHVIRRVFGFFNAQCFYKEIAESFKISGGLADEIDVSVPAAAIWVAEKEELYLF